MVFGWIVCQTAVQRLWEAPVENLGLFMPFIRILAGVSVGGGEGALSVVTHIEPVNVACGQPWTYKGITVLLLLNLGW